MKIDPKTYINQLFAVVDTKSILIYTPDKRFRRIYCPFYVKVLHDVGELKQGDSVRVSAVKMSLELIDIYIINGKAYYTYHFKLDF